MKGIYKLDKYKALELNSLNIQINHINNALKDVRDAFAEENSEKQLRALLQLNQQSHDLDKVVEELNCFVLEANREILYSE